MSLWPGEGAPAGVVFDCDGLLLETESLWTFAEQGVVEAWGGAWTVDLKRRLVGTSAERSGALMAEHVGADPVADGARITVAVQAAFAEVIRREPIRPMPGAAELVRALAGRVPLAVASNTRREHVVTALARSGLPQAFAAVVCAGDDGVRPKPAPDVYLAACAALGLAPSSCLGFEDSRTGAAAARAAGLRVVGVPSLPGHTLDDVDVLLGSLREVEVDDLLGRAA